MTGPMTEIAKLEDIPRFENEGEEVAFWATHSIGEELLEASTESLEGILPPPRSAPRPISVRMDADTLARLKKLARLKGKGYQTLLKEFVVERLYEEEKRAGLVS